MCYFDLNEAQEETLNTIFDAVAERIAMSDKMPSRKTMADIGTDIYVLVQDIMNENVDDILPVSDDEHEEYIKGYRAWLDDGSDVTITGQTLTIRAGDIKMVASLDTDKVYLTAGGAKQEQTIPEFLLQMREISRMYPADHPSNITNEWMGEILVKFFSNNIKNNG